MSIKGIDAQIMVTRSPDFAREASALLKKPEMTQEFLAAQTKLTDAQDQSRVLGTEQAEMDTIRSDVDGGSGGAYGGDGGAGSGEDENDEDIPVSMRVPPGNNVIDIKI